MKKKAAKTPKPMSTREQLLADIEAYCELTGEPESHIGTAVMGDTSLVLRIRAGGDVYTGTYDKIYAHIGPALGLEMIGLRLRQTA